MDRLERVFELWGKSRRGSMSIRGTAGETTRDCAIGRVPARPFVSTGCSANILSTPPLPETKGFCMNDVRIGYARCSTDEQDLTAQRDYLLGARVPEASIHLDHGLSGKDRARPALSTALAQV